MLTLTNSIETPKDTQALSIEQLQQRADYISKNKRSTNLKQGLNLFADLVANKIKIKTKTKSQTAVLISKAEMKELLSQYQSHSSPAEKKRVLCNALVDAEIVVRPLSDIEYRGKRGKMLIRSGSNFALCFENAAQKKKVKEFISTFGSFELKADAQF